MADGESGDNDKPRVVKKAERTQKSAEESERIKDEKLKALLMRVRADLFSIIYGIELFLDFPEEKRTSKRLKNK